MVNDAFTAGVVPGGVISHFEVKILICYLLSKEKKPINHDDFVSALTDEGLVNYFELTGAISELLDSKAIAQQGDGYVITGTGKQIAETLSEDLALTVREKSDSAIRLARVHEEKKKQNKVEIIETKNGYEVECTILDEGVGPLFSMRLYLPTYGAALKAKTNFIEKAEDILRTNLSTLTEENIG